MRTMAHPRKSHDHVSTNKAVSSVDNDKSAGVDPIDPSALGFTKVAYAVDETLELLSIGRTALYAAVKRGDIKRVKFGKKTLFSKSYTDDMYASPLDVGVIGALKSPFENRVAVVMIEINRGWEGPPHTADISIVGADLVKGFDR